MAKFGWREKIHFPEDGIGDLLGSIRKAITAVSPRSYILEDIN